jgi:hypothetical protein
MVFAEVIPVIGVWLRFCECVCATFAAMDVFEHTLSCGLVDLMNNFKQSLFVLVPDLRSQVPPQ